MKTKKLTPRNVAPVKRNSAATVSTKAGAVPGDISPLTWENGPAYDPFAGDDDA